MATFNDSVQSDEAAMVQPDGQVTEQIHEVNKWLTELAEVIDALHNKLASVIDRSASEMTDKDARPERVLVPLAEQIRSLHREMESQTERLRWMLRSVSI